MTPPVPANKIEPCVNHERVGATANVLAPANTWVPVDTSHLAVLLVSGRLNVCIFPEETILKSFPAIHIVKVCIDPVIPLSDPILLLKIFQSIAESAPVIVVDARARDMPEPAIERPLAVPETSETLLLNIVQSAPISAPVVVALAFHIENTHVVLL